MKPAMNTRTECCYGNIGLEKRGSKARAAVLFLLCTVLIGCIMNVEDTNRPESTTVTGVSLDRDTLSLNVNDTYQLTASIVPENATNQAVNWTSNASSVVSVGQSGLVTAHTEGTATITVTTEDGEHTDSCVVTVTIAPISATGISLDRDSLALSIDDSFQLTASLTPANASNKSVTWSSGTPIVATVDQSGLVTARSAGSATITVTTQDGNHSDSCIVSVTAISVTGISLDRDSLALGIDDSFQLSATLTPANASNKSMTWSSDNPTVATVDQSGLVTAKAEGSAVITVTNADGNQSDICSIRVYGKGAFVTVWDLNLSLLPTPTLMIPLHSTGNYNFIIDWGDGTTEEYSGLVHDRVTHLYTERAEYIVIITGTCEGFGSALNGVPSDDALIDIIKWGTVVLHNEGYQLARCRNLETISATDSPVLETITNLTGMFYQCQSFNADLSSWDTSGVSNMSRMFEDAFEFNGTIGTWNTSIVSNMFAMFRTARAFNQDLSAWDTNSVTDMSQMFYAAQTFNGDISTWDTTNVANMNNMFRDASSFNNDLNAWDTSNVENMSFMFSGAESFNGNISTWDTSSVTNMARMFQNASVFNQDLPWDTSNVIGMEYMFENALAFNGDISEWDTSLVANMSYMFFLAQRFNRDISEWNTSYVENMAYMFRRAELFNQDLSSWNTENVVNMDNMFNGATAFNSDLSTWNISGVTNMSMMFRSTSFTNGDNPEGLDSWEPLPGCNTANMFDYCPLNPQPDWYTN